MGKMPYQSMVLKNALIRKSLTSVQLKYCYGFGKQKVSLTTFRATRCVKENLLTSVYTRECKLVLRKIYLNQDEIFIQFIDIDEKFIFIGLIFLMNNSNYHKNYTRTLIAFFAHRFC